MTKYFVKDIGIWCTLYSKKIIHSNVEADLSNNNYPECFQVQNLGLSVLEDTTGFT